MSGLMLALAAALVLTAQPSNSWLEEARRLISELKFSEALEQLEVARQVPGLDAPQKQAVLEWMAYCQLAEGRRDDAQQSFIAILELDAGAVLSSDVSSPKVTEAFEEAKHKHFPADYVRLTEAQAPVGRAELVLVDPWRRVARVVLHQRRDGDAWREQALEGAAGRYTFPLVVAMGGELAWFVEARGEDDAIVAAVGSAQTPRVISVPRVEAAATAEAPPPSAARWVGVVSLGVGVALAATATALQVSAWNQRLAARDATRPPGDYAASALDAERDALVQQNWAVGLFIAGGLAVGAGVVLAW